MKVPRLASPLDADIVVRRVAAGLRRYLKREMDRGTFDVALPEEITVEPDPVIPGRVNYSVPIRVWREVYEFSEWRVPLGCRR